MNNNDLAALAALGAMGYMYKKHLDGQGAEAGPAGYEGVVPGSELGSQGNFRFGDAARGVGTAGPDKRSDMDDFATGNGGIRARDVVYGGGKGGRRGGGSGGSQAAGYTDVVPGSELGSQGNFRFSTPDVVPEVAPEVAPEESSGMGGAGLAAAGAGAAGAGAAAYYARLKAQSRLADEARARMKAEAQRGILKDRAQTGVDADRDARARAQNEADRAARAQAQAEAEANSRATQERIDSELRKNRTVRNDINERAAVLNKDMWAAGPTVTSETPTKKRAPIKAEVPTDMDDFNRMLRESKVGRANTSGPTATASRASADTQTREDAKAARARARLESSGTALPVPTTTTTAAPTENAARMTAAQKAAAKQAADMEAFNSMLREQKVGPAVEEGKRVKARGVAGKVGLGLTALGLGSAANAATNMTAGERERLGKDVVEGLITPLGLTPGMAGEGSDLYPSKPLSYAEKKKMVEAMSPADRKKMEEALARQGQDSFTFKDFKNYITSKKAGGGQIKAKKMASGGMTSTVSSASKRGDGIASKGKTRCKIY